VTQTTPLSLSLFGIAVGLYCLAVVAFAVAFAFRRQAPAGVGVGAVMLGWPFHLGSIIARTLESGHWPLGNMYEYSTGISFVIVTTYLVMAIRFRQRLLGLPAMMAAVALLGVAYMLYVPPGQLVPALHSYWLTIHVTAMASSSGILTFAFLFAMAYLLRTWADERAVAFRAEAGSTLLQSSTGGGVGVISTGGGLAAAIRRTLPAARTLDLWSYRFVMLGFPIWSFGVICGAIWGEHAWGRYWGWDPKETFAFITWVIFAIYLHARVTYGWREKRAAAIAGLGMVSILFTLYAVNLWIAGLHSYARA
jgi:cytochrome c-type biogenesis protein CcsB